MRDFLMTSKLKPCEGIKNQVETYLEETQLKDCIEAIDYEATREEEIHQEKYHLNMEVQHINHLAQTINKYSS